MSASNLEFWFDFANTYSYVSAARVEDAAAADVSLSWEAFLLGPIFKEQGWNDSPFNVYPAKGRYMWRDLERLCDGYGLPFARPTRFPRDSLLAAKTACLASAAAEPWFPDFCRAAFRANFADNREIGDPEEVRAILGSLDLPGRELVERAVTPENKRLLR